VGKELFKRYCSKIKKNIFCPIFVKKAGEILKIFIASLHERQTVVAKTN